MRGLGARFVYVIQSERDLSRHYVGRSCDVDARLEWHNAGPCGYTRRHRPWRVVVSLEFPSESAAARFEKYLESGSGRAFAKRHVQRFDVPQRAPPTSSVKMRPSSGFFSPSASSCSHSSTARSRAVAIGTERVFLLK
jgi:putative endonuclease